ncbi:MAG: hypothetical protein K0U84_14025 [Actinomycetia bacterium]|nr:hypothetical protein [Actinomycetes bacterium]
MNNPRRGPGPRRGTPDALDRARDLAAGVEAPAEPEPESLEADEGTEAELPPPAPPGDAHLMRGDIPFPDRGRKKRRMPTRRTRAQVEESNPPYKNGPKGDRARKK